MPPACRRPTDLLMAHTLSNFTLHFGAAILCIYFHSKCHIISKIRSQLTFLQKNCFRQLFGIFTTMNQLDEGILPLAKTLNWNVTENCTQNSGVLFTQSQPRNCEDRIDPACAHLRNFKQKFISSLEADSKHENMVAKSPACRGTWAGDKIALMCYSGTA